MNNISFNKYQPLYQGDKIALNSFGEGVLYNIEKHSDFIGTIKSIKNTSLLIINAKNNKEIIVKRAAIYANDNSS